MKYLTHRFQPDDGLEQSVVSLSPGTMYAGTVSICMMSATR